MVQVLAKPVTSLRLAYRKDIVACTTAITATDPASINRKTHASARLCSKPRLFRRINRWLCQDRDTCFKQYITPIQAYYVFSRTVLRSPETSASEPLPSVRPGQKPVVHRNGTDPTAPRMLSQPSSGYMAWRGWGQTSHGNQLPGAGYNILLPLTLSLSLSNILV